MRLKNLDNLSNLKYLKVEKFNQSEYDGLIASGMARLCDSKNHSIGLESRFLLVYNAAHALSLAALRKYHYRPDNRYIVFQALPHSLGLDSSIWRVLAKAHDMRNLAEYEGFLDVSESFVDELIQATTMVLDALNVST